MQPLEDRQHRWMPREKPGKAQAHVVHKVSIPGCGAPPMGGNRWIPSARRPGAEENGCVIGRQDRVQPPLATKSGDAAHDISSAT
jgi:hypothetical protein